jgi:hypothetical protein
MANQPAEAEVNNRAFWQSRHESWRPDTPLAIGDVALDQRSETVGEQLINQGELDTYESD